MDLHAETNSRNLPDIQKFTNALYINTSQFTQKSTTDYKHNNSHK